MPWAVTATTDLDCTSIHAALFSRISSGIFLVVTQLAMMNAAWPDVWNHFVKQRHSHLSAGNLDHQEIS